MENKMANLADIDRDQVYRDAAAFSQAGRGSAEDYIRLAGEASGFTNAQVNQFLATPQKVDLDSALRDLKAKPFNDAFEAYTNPAPAPAAAAAQVTSDRPAGNINDVNVDQVLQDAYAYERADRGTPEQYIQEAGIANNFAQNDINSVIRQLGNAQQQQFMLDPRSLTQTAPEGAYSSPVPTFNPLAAQAAQPVGMMSTGYQSPMPSDISSLFNLVQDTRNTNQGYFGAPRADLGILRENLMGEQAAKEAMAREAMARQQAAMQAQNGAVVGGGEYGNTLDPRTAAFFDNETPGQRDVRMTDFNNFFSSDNNQRDYRDPSVVI